MADSAGDRRLKEEIRRNEVAVRERERTQPSTPPPADVPGLPPELQAQANALGLDLAGLGIGGPSYPNLPIADDFAQLPVVRPVLGLGGLGPADERITIGEWMNEFAGLGQKRISTYQDMMVRAGLLGEGNFIPGIADKSTLGALGVVLGAANNSGMSAENVLAVAMRNQEGIAARSGGGGGGGGRRPALQLQVSNRDELRSLLDNAAQSVIGRNLESLGLNPDEFADAVQAAERDIQTRSFNMQVNNQGGEIEQMESASSRARRFLEGQAAPQIEARQMASAMSMIEQLVRGS